MQNDYSIQFKETNTVFSPHIIINKADVGDTVLLVKNNNLDNCLCLLQFFIVEANFIDEFAKELINFPETDYIYFMTNPPNLTIGMTLRKY